MSPLLSRLLLIVIVAFCALLRAADAPLTIAAASDLSSLGPKLQTLYEQQHTGSRVRFVFSASAMLRQQIEAAAPFDVFLSANASYVDQLADEGKIDPASVITYAHGRVGVLWRDGKKHALREMTTPAVRYVALPNPKLAPYGQAAHEALQYGGLWQMVEGKVVYAEDVRQALQMVESGNADVVLTADSLLQGKGADLIPADWHKPIVQKGGVVTASQQKPAATRFLDFLKSPAAQKLFASAGFSAQSPQSK